VSCCSYWTRGYPHNASAPHNRRDLRFSAAGIVHFFND
jgi:hypothetical protein